MYGGMGCQSQSRAGLNPPRSATTPAGYTPGAGLDEWPIGSSQADLMIIDDL